VGIVLVLANRTGDRRQVTEAAVCRADYKSVETAVGAYYAQTGGYPANVAALTQAVLRSSGHSYGPWLRTVPANPHYSIKVDPTTGAVTTRPACRSLG
jgi:hypothetical protein